MAGAGARVRDPARQETRLAGRRVGPLDGGKGPLDGDNGPVDGGIGPIGGSKGPLEGVQPMSTAYPGLMTSSMMASRSSKWMNADFIAFTVNRSRSAQP
ncbi:hypothetical protein ACVWY6_002588 [Williamsia sp. R60]